MKGSECKLMHYMDGSRKRFVIPVYQRNYDWKRENCKQLYDDLVRIVRENRKSHFFGSLVSVYNSEGRQEEFLVIDGQQRLTTVSLLFLAMCHFLEQGSPAAEDVSLRQEIYENYLIDKHQPEEKRIKLKPVKNDRHAFDQLFAPSRAYVRDSNLTNNYLYFCERIQEQEISLEQLYDAIWRLEIIDIKLNPLEDNPQLIFESLNSTGLDLSEGDKIRNLILMGLPTRTQEKYYETFWNPIEVCTGYDVSSFIRDFLSVKQLSIPQQKRVYARFKDYVEEQQLQTEPLLQELFAYARRYQTLLAGKTESSALNGCIFRLNHLETTVTRPFFLEVLRLYDEKLLSLSQVTEVFLITESYLFRRTICDLPTSSLNRIFLMLHHEILRFDGGAAEYVEKFKYALLSKKERSRLPHDEEFVRDFAGKQVYRMNSKNRIYILERLENAGTAEDKDVYRRCEEGIYSIEHIMPQNLTPAWQRELGEDYEQIHELWLHRLANLTLTAYNSSYSNRSFMEKRTMKNGFESSGIRMNMWIARKSQWTLAELTERGEALMEQALDIWPSPVTQYQPAKRQLDSCTLEDEAELTGRQIVRFSFQNTEQPVASWIEMFQKMVQILYAEDKGILTRLALSSEEGLAAYFRVSTDAHPKCLEVGDGIYVWSNTSTKSKLSILSRLFALYNVDPSELVFYLRSENETEEDEPGSRHEWRRKYWASALPLIKEAVGENGPFSRAVPSRENWLSGYFGVNGIHLTCIANQDSARVEFVFDHWKKEENKAEFDALQKHQAEIEAELGVRLQWNRGEEIKASRVYLQLDGVSLAKEADWPRIAGFHAHWCRKFYECLAPYVMGEAPV